MGRSGDSAGPLDQVRIDLEKEGSSSYPPDLIRMHLPEDQAGNDAAVEWRFRSYIPVLPLVRTQKGGHWKQPPLTRLSGIGDAGVHWPLIVKPRIHFRLGFRRDVKVDNQPPIDRMKRF